jgi:hypothetical protein
MYVSDNFRTNQLSKIPGGSVVTVNFSNKKPLKYDKIKSAKMYTNKIIKEAKLSGEFDSILSIEDSEGTTWYAKKK